MLLKLMELLLLLKSLEFAPIFSDARVDCLLKYFPFDYSWIPFFNGFITNYTQKLPRTDYKSVYHINYCSVMN